LIQDLRPERAGLFVAVLASGACGLSWEIVWQHHASLALGASAYGTAVTLAAVMLGLGLGGLLAARLSRQGLLGHPLRAYGLAEAAVGLCGLLVPWLLDGLGILDTRLYPLSPAAADALRAVGTAAALLPAAIPMGATLPILAPVAARTGSSLAALYALNVLGAVAGILLATFALIPYLGIARSEWTLAATHLAVALWALTRSARTQTSVREAAAGWPAPGALALAFASGFVIFALEVSWFRSIRAAFQSTTESFALVLAAFLLALAGGAAWTPSLRARAPWALGALPCLAALAVLATTPLIDQLDRFVAPNLATSWSVSSFDLAHVAARFGWVLALTAVPVALAGTLFPWLLVEHATSAGAGRLYAVNTLGAVAGSLASGFVLLPHLGATRGSFAAAALLAASSLWISGTPAVGRTFAALLSVALASLAALGTSSARLRVQGEGSAAFAGVEFVSEGPDSTVSVTRNQRTGKPLLVIDGFIASSELAGTDYMEWMGHLPALATPELRRALVICFGTGRTAAALLRHGPERLDVAELNEAVLEAAPLFPSNGGVLESPNVTAVVVDGRAFLRRTEGRPYDVVTLEPMPPNFAGSNQLYSVEFYRLAASRLAPRGAAAQWVPFHLVAPEHVRAIVASFREVFPFTRLWIDPQGGTGVLVGSRAPWELRESAVSLPLGRDAVLAAFELGREELAALARGARTVTDDNQLLAYGPERFARVSRPGPVWASSLAQRNLALVRAHRRLRTPGVGLVGHGAPDPSP
jgi:predicted membrane-bound spermidine synthase